MASKSIQRSLILLREEGYVCGITEKFNSFVRIRQDYPYDSNGFADIIAYHPNRNEVLAIQACSDNGGDVMAHSRKIKKSINAYKWVLQDSRRLEIWGFGKRGKRGKRKVWTLRKIPIRPEDFDEQKNK